MSVLIAYIGVIIIWSTTPLAIYWSGEQVGFLFGVTSRMVVGALVCLGLMASFRVRLPWSRPALQTYLAAGLGLSAGMLLVYWSSQFIPSGWISVIFGLVPAVTGLMAALWLKEDAFTPWRISGMVLGLAGLGFIFRSGSLLGPDAIYGIIGMLLSVVTHSASAVAVKRIDAQLPALATAAGGLVVCVPVLLAIYVFTDETLPTVIPARAAWSILYLGVVGSVLGFFLYFYLLKRIEATRASLITLITPVIALALGAILNGEPLRTEIWAGTAMIVCRLLLFEFGAKFLCAVRL